MIDDPAAADLARARKLLNDFSRIPHLPWRRGSNSRTVIRRPAISPFLGEKRKSVAVEEAGNQVATRRRRGLPGSICDVRLGCVLALGLQGPHRQRFRRLWPTTQRV